MSVRVYNVQGRLVRDLQEGWVTPGVQRIVWDGRDRGGRELASGIYFVRLSSDDVSVNRKVVLMR